MKIKAHRVSEWSGLALMSLVVSAGVAIAEPLASPGPLGGPKVLASDAPSTLVARDMAGRVIRLEIPAEEAALELLTLDAVTKEAVDRILDERARILDQLVVENIETLGRMRNSFAAGNRKEAAAMLRELTSKAKPLRERGRLRDEIASVLPAEQQTAFAALVTGYWDAIRAEIKAEQTGAEPAPADDQDASDQDDRELKGAGVGQPGKRAAGPIASLRGQAQGMAREYLMAIGQEIKRSYERTIARQGERFESIMTRLELSAESETKVRNLVTEHAQRTKLNSTPAQRRELFVKIFGVLTPEERIRAIEVLRSEDAE
ncbi:MAG: hypothetical protein SFZ23_03890 [Planctomycetota bacterium]|nr:hypothetical protein [Planctomycetota bacterium]